MKQSKKPSFLDKWNAIIDFIIDPCDAPFLLYVELALPPLGKAIIMWFSFGLDDVIRGYFRPKGLRTARHGRGGKRGGKKPGRIRKALSRIPGIGDDVGDFVGQHLPGAKEAKGRVVSQGVKHLWILDGFVQRGLFYWLVADLVTDFLYDWTSLLQESEYCHRDKNSSLYAEGGGGGLPFGGIWYNVEAPTVVKTTGNIGWAVSAANCPNGDWTAICGVRYRNLSTQPVTFDGRVIVIQGGGVTVQEGQSTGCGPLSEAELVITGTMSGPGIMYFQARTSITAAVGVHADVWVTGDAI